MMPTLHPDHLEDLRRSGLSDATIVRCAFAAVPPADLHEIAGITHAYRLPYFSLDGSINGFHRLRLFPPRQTKDGTQKYHQPAGSDPHLYLPPLVDWPTIAADPTVPLLLI